VSVDFDRIIDRRGTGSSKWARYAPDVLPLWVADMDFASPREVIEALHARVEHGVFGYGYKLDVSPLHEVFAERLAKRYGWRVPLEAILPIPGVIAGFNVACRLLTTPGDGLVLQTPVYPPILRVPGNLGLTLDEAPLARGADGRYAVDADAFARAIGPRTRAFLLCNPHNPVGRVFTRAELTTLAETCLRRGVAICADEIHCELLAPGHEHVPIASLDPDVAARTITLMAPSKTFNLPGLKCALAIVPDAALRARFVAGLGDVVPSVNVLGYTAALAAYRDGQAWLDALLAYLTGNRDLVVDFVGRQLPGVSVRAPEATYLAWLDCRAAGAAAGDPYTFFLERARVALNDGAAFGNGGAGFVRLNFAAPRAVVAEGLERMRAALA
jgi:cysteine-S-conjugate beta-lyase